MIDFHTDTVYQLVMNNSSETLCRNSYAVDAERMIKGGVKAVCFALFTPEENDLGLTRWQMLSRLHDRFVRDVENSNGLLRQASSSKEIENNISSAVLTVEDIGPFGGDMERLKLLKEWRVRIASLIWNNENVYAYPNSRDDAIMSKGLKKKGHEAVEALAEMDIIIDVSHLNDGGFYDIYEKGVKMIATHSNSRSICNHTRNITDDMAVKIAERGGIIGLNVCPIFLYPYPADMEMGRCESRISDMVRHIMHLYNVAGEDVIAIGSDLDGTEGVLELGSVLDYGMLYAPLKAAGLKERQLEKFYYGNGLRVLE